MTPIVVAAFLAIVANRLVEALFKPLWDKYQLDTFWLMYVAWGVAGGLVAASGVNLFVEYLPNAVLGQVLTAIVAGGGANFLHDLFDFAPLFAEKG